MVSGARPSAESIRAPMAVSGSMTRRMGRFDRDASPMSVVGKGRLARMPDSSRIVVPELAASSATAGALNPARPRPMIRTAPGPVASTSTPRPRMHATLAATSAPGARWVMLVTPSDNPPSSTYRWEMDLSPGTGTTPRTCGVGWIASLSCITSGCPGPRAAVLEPRRASMLLTPRLWLSTDIAFV